MDEPFMEIKSMFVDMPLYFQQQGLTFDVDEYMKLMARTFSIPEPPDEPFIISGD